ncbi:hypothetical protein GF342_00855 [Candidatus Woesearchaeota archaeon]|nr:hypothetical protein [Candidatus Woesearchaeota archaeon]
MAAKRKKKSTAKKKTTTKKSPKKTRKSPKNSPKKSPRKTKPRNKNRRAARQLVDRSEQTLVVVTAFFWLVLIDGLVSLFHTLSATVFYPNQDVGAMGILAGIVGLSTLLLSVIFLIYIMVKRLPAWMQILPVYVILAPLVLELLRWLAEEQGVPSMIPVLAPALWIAIIAEILLGAWAIYRYR